MVGGLGQTETRKNVFEMSISIFCKIFNGDGVKCSTVCVLVQNVWVAGHHANGERYMGAFGA